MLNRIETSKENETEEKRTLTHLSRRYVKRRSPLAKIDEVYMQYSDFHLLFQCEQFIAGQKRRTKMLAIHREKARTDIAEKNNLLTKT